MEGSEVDYIEAHGTGTEVGDPVELEAIGAVIGGARRHVCGVGSIKTNLGHLESAAGAAGVAKVALALERGLIPARFTGTRQIRGSFRSSGPPNSIRSRALALRCHRALAGVSGFGITGTNAHILLQAAPREERAAVPVRSGPYLLPLSAHNPLALAARAESYRDSCGEQSVLSDLCWTVAVRRTHLPYRIGIVAANHHDLKDALEPGASPA